MSTSLLRKSFTSTLTASAVSHRCLVPACSALLPLPTPSSSSVSSPWSTSQTRFASNSREFKTKKAPKKGGSGKSGGKKFGGRPAEEDEEDEDDDYEDDEGADLVKKKSKGGSKKGAAVEELDENDVLEEVGENMATAIAKLAEKCSEARDRAKGKVASTLLDSVKVVIEGESYSLNDVATVAAKGNTLTISVFDEEHLKAVEQSIHGANIPGISPTKVDARNLKASAPVPNKSERQLLLNELITLAEETRGRVRSERQHAIKALGKDFNKEIQDVVTTHSKTLEAQMVKIKVDLS